MNTKKFIASVNSLDNYHCEPDKNNSNAFYVMYGNRKAIFINTFAMVYNITDLTFRPTRQNDRDLNGLLGKYLHAKTPWVCPQDDWYKLNLTKLASLKAANHSHTQPKSAGLKSYQKNMLRAVNGIYDKIVKP